MTDAADHFLTLGLGAEIFGLDVRHVREILDMRTMAALPHAPPFLLGMTDVRGQGIPVVDLRLRLGLPPAEHTAATRIVILDVLTGERRTSVGFVADRVIEVTGLDSRDLDPPPAVGGRWQSRCMAGIGRKGDTFVFVLDIDHLLLGADDVLADAA